MGNEVQKQEGRKMKAMNVVIQDLWIQQKKRQISIGREFNAS